MQIDEYTSIGVTAILGVIGYIAKVVHKKLSRAVTEDQVKEMINARIAPLEEKQRDLKEDIKSMDDKVEYIIKLLMENLKKLT